MAVLMILLCMTGQPSHGEVNSSSPGFRFGSCFIISCPSMQNEKDFAEMNNEAGGAFELGSVAFGGSIELLADMGDRFRIRGSFVVSRLTGAYEEEFNPAIYGVLGVFTCGWGLLFYNPSEDVIYLNDEAVSIEAEAYYLFSREDGFSFSVGAGPVYTWATRKLDSPNTSTKGSGSAFGLLTSLRLDQESTINIGCIPMIFGLEAGYRFNNVEIDGQEDDGYTLDFSGPFVKLGSYIGF